MERLRGVPGLNVSDFGTRRRHSFLWQEYVVKAMSDVLGENFIGSSNTYLAYTHDLEAIGTNAHELPMAMAALANSDDEIRAAQYRVLELWQQTYQGELLIMLPDTFGTTQFLENAPDWVANWTGQRIDSKDPYIAGDEYIAWLLRRGRDPLKKRLIASDALDVDTILASTLTSAARSAMTPPLRISTTPPIFSTAKNGCLNAYTLQRWLGHLSHQRLPRLQPARRRKL